LFFANCKNDAVGSPTFIHYRSVPNVDHPVHPDFLGGGTDEAEGFAGFKLREP
jgi:hypothetical protein